MTKKYNYMIAIDMDGTLLREDKTISKETIEYIKSLDEKGFLVVIASGRPYRAIKDYYEEMNMKSPIICYNGALVFNPSDKLYPKTRYMFEAKTIKSILKAVGEENFNNILVENDKSLYLKDYIDELDKFFHFKGMEIHQGNIMDILDQKGYACIFNTPHDPHIRETLIKVCFSFDNLGIRFWTGESSTTKEVYSELYYLNVSKYAAIEDVRKYYHIEKDNVMCFGDAENDIEMLRNVTHSVVMRNGSPELREEAKYISIDTNENDGVRKTIEKLIDELGWYN